MRLRSSFLVAPPIFASASLRQTSHTRERYVKYSFSFLGYRPPIFPPGQFLFERGVNMVFSPLHPENDLFIREKRYNYLIKPNEQHARINRINQRKKYYRP